MTSILGIPATYVIEYLGWCNGWTLTVDDILLDVHVFNTKQEAEDFARQHYANEETK